MVKLMKSSVLRRVAMLLVVSMTLLSLVPPVDAGYIGSDESWGAADRQQDAATVQTVLERKVVMEQLKALGYTESEIADRVAQLSGEDMHRFATQANAVTAAGDAISTAIGLLIIVVLVVVILQLTDRRVVVG